MKDYKVLSQKDKWYSGKFDPEALEAALNSYAKQGWEVKAAVTASIPGAFGNREELVIILERPTPGVEPKKLPPRSELENMLGGAPKAKSGSEPPTYQL